MYILCYALLAVLPFVDGIKTLFLLISAAIATLIIRSKIKVTLNLNETLPVSSVSISRLYK